MRITDLNDPNWSALFSGVAQSWFRLERLQAYDAASERAAYTQFLRTGVHVAEPGSWQDLLAAHCNAGRQLRRVHIVEEPLTDYIRFDLAAYALNEQAGEDIRLLPVAADQWPEGLPRGPLADFWLFDDTRLWSMEYDDKGRFVAVELKEDPHDVAQAQQWRDRALAAAVSLGEYQRRQ